MGPFYSLLRHSFTWLCSGSIHCRLQRHSFTWHFSGPFDSHFRVPFLLTYVLFLLGVFRILSILTYVIVLLGGLQVLFILTYKVIVLLRGFSGSFYSDFRVLFILTYSFAWRFGFLLFLLLFVVVVVVLLFCVCVCVCVCVLLFFKIIILTYNVLFFTWRLSGLFILAYNGIVLLGGTSYELSNSHVQRHKFTWRL